MSRRLVILDREHGDALEAAALGGVVVVDNVRVIPVSLDVFEVVQEVVTGHVMREGDEWFQPLPYERTQATDT